MPLPAGLVLEQDVNQEPLTEGKLPDGLVPEVKAAPELRAAPEPGLFDKVTNFFKDEDRYRARASNIYALSEATGLPLQEVNKNYDTLRFSSKATGMKGFDDKEFLQKMMIPGIAVGMVMNPVGTAAGLIGFGLLDKAIPTDKLIKKMEEEGIKEDFIHAVELADFVGKGMLAGGIFRKAPGVAEKFLKVKATEYKLPERLSLTPEQVRDIYQTGELTTSAQKSLWAGLELNSFDRRAALEHGIAINVPSEKIVRVVDNPLWAKVKNMFGKEVKAEVKTDLAGKPEKGPLGLLENKEGEVIGKIIKEPVTEKAKVNPVEKLISALEKSKSVRAKQETLYEEARAKKFGKLMGVRQGAKGEAGFFKELGALKGELPKVEFEAIRGEVGQQDIDSLFQQVRESKKIGEWDKINAMEGLGKMFGEFGGRVPTEGELKLLGEVFGQKLVEALLEKRTLFAKMKDAALQIANIPRAIMASMDLSAPMRQGVFLIGRQKQFQPAFKKMFKQFVSEKAYQDAQDAIITHPDYQLARDSRLSLTDVDVLFANREEAFMSSWAEKIPLIGAGVKASNRAYVGFLNKLRFDTFVDMVAKAENLGLKPKSDRDLSVKIADFINNATGRGTLPGSLQNAAVALNSIFFSPRLIMSRLNLLNPFYYTTREPFVRKEALKSLFTFVGIGVTILSLAKLMGAEVGTDPRSSDFGKIKIKNTRIDVWGGFQPLVRSAAQIISGKSVSSVTGKEVTLGEGFRPLTRADIVERIVAGKLAPVPSFVYTLLKQVDPLGEAVKIPKEIVERFTPMIMQDLLELAKSDPELLPVTILELFGVGVQTYENKARKGF
jgi:hypothetical protein